MAKFTASTLTPVGRESTIAGAKTHLTYSNRHAVVTYDLPRKDGALYVTVQLADGYSRRWRTIAHAPSVGMARMAAEAAHRQRSHTGAES
jgi:hypothetical protein